jgi:hypothetical protein
MVNEFFGDNVLAQGATIKRRLKFLSNHICEDVTISKKINTFPLVIGEPFKLRLHIV